MCLSALVESEAYKTGNLVNTETVMTVTASLVHLYATYDFLRESIQTALAKLITNLPVESHAVKVLEKLVTELLTVKKEQGDLRSHVFAHSDNLSLFLTLRQIFTSPQFKDQSTKVAKVLGMDVLADDNDLVRLKNIVGKSVYLYPRLHSSLPLLIKEIYLKNASSAKLRLQLIKKLAKSLLEDYFFSEQVYQAIKSSATRPKFLHIGLKFWELLGTSSIARESKTEVKN